jgi:hypothetical protein
VTIDHKQIWTVGPFRNFGYHELERQRSLSFRTPNREIVIRPEPSITGRSGPLVHFATLGTASWKDRDPCLSESQTAKSRFDRNH